LKDADGKAIEAGVFAAVPYCIDLIGGPYVETHEAVVKSFRPKSAVRAADRDRRSKCSNWSNCRPRLRRSAP